MPRLEDYNKKTKYDQLFMSMDDDQFLAFVKEDELLEYPDAEKTEMLSKMMVGRRLQMVNGMNQNQIISFNLDSARKLAKDIQNSPAFKEIVRTKEVDTYLAKSKEELADAAMGVFHPFNKVPFENFELQNSSDSRFNGEDLFEEIFNSSAAYMKGRSTVSTWSDEAMTGTPRDYMLTISVQDV